MSGRPRGERSGAGLGLRGPDNLGPDILGLGFLGLGFFGFALLFLGLLAMVGAAQAEPIGSAVARAGHALDRAAFGPRPGDLAQVAAVGPERWLESQLHPESIPMPPGLQQRLDGLETLRMSPLELFRTYGPPGLGQGKPVDPEAVKEARMRARLILRQAAEARLLRAVESPRQLQEVMVDFWFNHFNVFSGKGLTHLWVASYEEQAIRPYALGRFRDLLGATARHPAMLFYLDNWQNTAPGAVGARGKEAGLNENYARELMELHTLGVDGGYSQADVTALARIFTGWGLPRGRGAGLRARMTVTDGFFYFDPDRHDGGNKQFLGQTIAGQTIAASGMAEGEQALDLLARSPATARHIAFQLAQYFVSDQPDPDLVAQLAARFQATDGDIAEVLRALFGSKQFWDARTLHAKYKTPYQYVVSAARASGRPLVNPLPLFRATLQLGMPLYGAQTPDGYKNTREAWLGPDGTTKRIGFATRFGTGHLPIDRPAQPIVDRPAAELVREAAMEPESMSEGDAAVSLDAGALMTNLGPRFSARTIEAIRLAEPRLRAALVLGSPDFMER